MKHSSKSTGSKPVQCIFITTGDRDGVGWEVAAKALNQLGPQKGYAFVVFASAQTKLRPHLNKKFKVAEVTTLKEALQHKATQGTLILVRNNLNPVEWVEQAALQCLSNKHQALVTAPLSKTTIKASGRKDIGHTEILARLSGTKDLFMGFVGEKFSVVLATGHQPLRDATKSLSPRRMKAALTAAFDLRSCLPKSKQRLPIAIVGANPHAGENGLLGSEEKWMKKLTGQSIKGPLVPDAAFLPKNWKLHSVYVVPFHDQGLIPFKLVHGFEGGVHLTLNLPFVRTSVDHGTAKDIFGLNKADPGSMIDAIVTAMRLLREKQK